MPPEMLIIDCNYLCHRAFHVTGKLTYANEWVGVLYGFFVELITLRNRHPGALFVFCFDGPGKSERAKAHPFYKATRVEKLKKETPLEQEMRKGLCQQIDDLHSKYLPQMGYKNVLRVPGFEGDDLMALALRDIPTIIVTGDHDLYQLIDHQTSVYHPQSKKTIDLAAFTAEWGIKPESWPYVKAIAGCTSDNVPGVSGVGEKTATKFLLGDGLGGEYKPGSKMKAIQDFWLAGDVSRNLDLVWLPYPTTPDVGIEFEDMFSEKAFREILRSLGMDSIADYTTPDARRPVKTTTRRRA